jgi:large subunit ribosomal protein L11
MTVLHTVTIFLRAQMAESGPPLGTILGNLGINTIKFCKEFNDFTSELPSYFLLKVKILVLEDKSISFTVKLPSIGNLIGLLKFDRKVEQHGKEIIQSCILMKHVVQLAKLKFPHLDLKFSMSIVCGSVNSFKDLLIV